MHSEKLMANDAPNLAKISGQRTRGDTSQNNVKHFEDVVITQQ